MNAKSKQLYFVGSYAAQDQAGVTAFDFDPAAGDVTVRGKFSGIRNPSFLALHPNGRWLYAVSETGLAQDGDYGSIWSLSYERPSLDVQPINSRSTGGDWPCHLEIDRSGRWIVASNYGTGNAALFPILDGGELGEMAAFVQHEGQGPNTARQEGPHAHSATFSPDNRFLIVADLGIDQLMVYQFDEETGSLTLRDSIQTAPGAGPRHMVFHPGGRRVFVANELDSTVTVYDYRAADGALQALQTLSTLPSPDPESTVADIHLSASGRQLYVSNRGHNSIAVFEVEEDGRVTLQGIFSCGGDWPRNFAVGPADQFLLVANRRSNQISIMSLDDDGGIGRGIQQIPILQPSCVLFAP